MGSCTMANIYGEIYSFHRERLIVFQQRGLGQGRAAIVIFNLSHPRNRSGRIPDLGLFACHRIMIEFGQHTLEFFAYRERGVIFPFSLLARVIVMDCVFRTPSTLSPDNQCVFTMGFRITKQRRLTPLRLFSRGQSPPPKPGTSTNSSWCVCQQDAIISIFPSAVPVQNSQGQPSSTAKYAQSQSFPQLHSTTLALLQMFQCPDNETTSFFTKNP